MREAARDVFRAVFLDAETPATVQRGKAAARRELVARHRDGDGAGALGARRHGRRPPARRAGRRWTTRRSRATSSASSPRGRRRCPRAFSLALDVLLDRPAELERVAAARRRRRRRAPSARSSSRRCACSRRRRSSSARRAGRWSSRRVAARAAHRARRRRRRGHAVGDARPLRARPARGAAPRPRPARDPPLRRRASTAASARRSASRSSARSGPRWSRAGGVRRAGR